MQSYPIYMLASIVFLVNGLLGANNGFQSDMYTSSGELINAFRMEQELVRSLKDIQLQNFNHHLNKVFFALNNYILTLICCRLKY